MREAARPCVAGLEGRGGRCGVGDRGRSGLDDGEDHDGEDREDLHVGLWLVWGKDAFPSERGREVWLLSWLPERGKERAVAIC